MHTRYCNYIQQATLCSLDSDISIVPWPSDGCAAGLIQSLWAYILYINIQAVSVAVHKLFCLP